MIYLGTDGPRLVPLGRGTTQLHGEDLDQETGLKDGERVTLPGLSLTLESEEHAQSEEPKWLLERVGGGLFGIARSPFTVGGGSKDDIRIEGWPEGIFTFQGLSGALYVEAAQEARLNGDPLERNSLVPVRPGSKLEVQGDLLRVLTSGELNLTDSTVPSQRRKRAPLPIAVQLEFLPRGGRLRIEDLGGRLVLYLPGRRCDLVAALLKPPTPYKAGELIPDEVVMPRVWPGESKTRADLNVLVHRLRKDLIRAGVDGPSLVVRAKGGGATRFAVAREGEVSLI